MKNHKIGINMKRFKILFVVVGLNCSFQTFAQVKIGIKSGINNCNMKVVASENRYKHLIINNLYNKKQQIGCSYNMLNLILFFRFQKLLLCQSYSNTSIKRWQM